MKRLEVSGAVRPIYGSLGVKRIINIPPHHLLKKNLYVYDHLRPVLWKRVALLGGNCCECHYWTRFPEFILSFMKFYSKKSHRSTT